MAEDVNLVCAGETEDKVFTSWEDDVGVEVLDLDYTRRKK